MGKAVDDRDLRHRRRSFGFTVEEMAVGIGLRRAEVREIESGTASNTMLNHYAGWLGRMDRWSIDERDQQQLRARKGERFTLR